MTHVDWHPYPQQKPKENRFYLVTVKLNEQKPFILSLPFFPDLGFFDTYANNKFYVAWAEMPEPYRPTRRR